MEKEFINIFTQTEFDTSSSAEVSPKHILSTPQGYFRNLEDLLTQAAFFPTQYASLKFDDDDEFSAVNDTILDNGHVALAQTDYHSTHTATHPS